MVHCGLAICALRPWPPSLTSLWGIEEGGGELQAVGPHATSPDISPEKACACGVIHSLYNTLPASPSAFVEAGLAAAEEIWARGDAPTGEESEKKRFLPSSLLWPRSCELLLGREFARFHWVCKICGVDNFMDDHYGGHK